MTPVPTEQNDLEAECTGQSDWFKREQHTDVFKGLKKVLCCRVNVSLDPEPEINIIQKLKTSAVGWLSISQAASLPGVCWAVRSKLWVEGRRNWIPENKVVG